MSELLINGIRDQRIQETMISITEVDLSGDLQHCKIFVSIYGEDSEKDRVFKALELATSFIKGEVGRRLQMRRTPEILFKLDRGMEKSTSVLNLLGQLEQERTKKDNSHDQVEELS